MKKPSERKGIYLSPEIVLVLTGFFRKSSKLLQEAMDETHNKYPKLFDEEAENEKE